ncbi:MAG TPA: hypothetical protein VGE04_18170 [Chloroflexia bacterium]
MTTNTDDPATSMLLAEYAALRQEMTMRLEMQHQILAVALVAVGTFIQFGNSTSILFYPILGLFLASAWAEDGLRIRRTAAYIKDGIEERLLPPGEGWQHVNARFAVGRGGGLSHLTARGIFVGTQLTAIVVALLKTVWTELDIGLLVVNVPVLYITISMLRHQPVTLPKP